MAPNRLSKTSHLITSLFRKFYTEPAKEALVDFNGLPTPVRLLVIIGYLGIFSSMASMVWLESEHLPLKLIPILSGSTTENDNLSIPLLVMIFCSLGLATAWAFLLSGAAASSRRVFFPVFFLFAFQVFLLTGNTLSGVMDTPQLLWSSPFCCTAPMLLIILAIVFFFFHKRAFWNRTLITWVVFFILASFYIIGLWIAAPDFSTIAYTMDVSFTLMFLFAIPWWVLNGLSVVHASLAFGRKAASLIRGLIPGNFLRILVLFCVFIQPTTILISMLFKMENTLLGQTLILQNYFTLPLIIICLVLLIIKRWSVRNAVIILALWIAAPLFTLGVLLGLRGIDIFNMLENTAKTLFSPSIPLLIFVALSSYNILVLGTNFTRKDSKSLPRPARVLLSFGVAFMVVFLTIFQVNGRFTTTGILDNSLQNFVDNCFSTGLFFIGIPYLLWIVIKHPNRLADQEVGFPQTPGTETWNGCTITLAIFLILAGISICLGSIAILAIIP
jgi:hypothetical protein